MRKRAALFSLALIVLITPTTKVHAQEIINLKEYIAGPNFVEHTLSTGEVIRFTSEGNGEGAVRQYKNNNYEQFFIKGDGIYRREDTSWAPIPGFQDAYCTNGNKAIYALDPYSGSCSGASPSIPVGGNVSSTGALWAPSTAQVGVPWNTGGHWIIPIDSGVSSGQYDYNLPPLTRCDLSNLSGYPACVASGTQQGVVSKFFPAGTFTFCTGVKNTVDLIEISGSSGPGGDDVFYFMKGWGLVGFSAPGFEAGLLDGPNISGGSTANCTAPSGTVTELPRQIMGFVTGSKKLTDTLGREYTNYAVQGATVCAYQGTEWFNGLYSNSGNIGTNIETFAGSAITNEDGFYALDTAYITAGNKRSFFNLNTPPSNFVAFLCGRELKDIYRIDVRKTISGLNFALTPRYKRAYRKYIEGSPEIDKSIMLEPIDTPIVCDPTNTPGVFDNPAIDTEGVTHPECPASLTYVIRSQTKMLSCASGGATGNSGDSGAGVEEPTEVNPTMNAIPEQDKRYIGANPNNVKERVQAPDPEGRVNTNASLKDLYGVAMLTQTIAGGMLEGHEPPPAYGTQSKLYDCESLKLANMAVGSAFSQDINLLTGNGFATLLAPPYFYTDIEKNPESLAALYNAKRDQPICTSEEYGIVNLKQIQPPSGVIPPEENCTPGETKTDGTACPFLLSFRYFPTWALRLLAAGTSIASDLQVLTDSYGAGIERLRDAWMCGPPGVACNDANFADPYLRNSGGANSTKSIVPSDVYGIYGAVNKALLTTSDIDGNKPPTDLLKSPVYNVGVPAGKTVDYDTEYTTDAGEVYTLKGLDYISDDNSTVARIGLPAYLCSFARLIDEHNLYPVNFRIISELPDNTGVSRSAAIYDFNKKPFEEEVDTGTIFGKPHSGTLLSSFKVLAQYIINMFNWHEHEDSSCIAKSIRTCQIMSKVPGAQCGNGDCSGCTPAGCSWSEEEQKCTLPTGVQYTCPNQAFETDGPLKLQMTATMTRKSPNAGYSADAFVQGLMSPLQKLSDVAGTTGIDTYGTGVDKQWEGGFISTDKDLSPTVDMLKQLVRAPEYGHGTL